ncbi:MAG: hypothetical protein M3552_10115 [Planctomycetota bacterium]|nr:hypothetical protein [Planctomycetota bacterium]
MADVYENQDLSKLIHGKSREELFQEIFNCVATSTLRKSQADIWIEGASTRNFIGYLTPDAAQPGRYLGQGIDTAGQQVRFATYSDSQSCEDSSTSFEDGSFPFSIGKEAAAEPFSYREVATDSNQTVSAREEAIQLWILDEPNAAASFVASELLNKQLAEDWRNFLIFTAEDIHFSNPEERQQVGWRLREIADEIRTSKLAANRYIVWSALRRSSSILGTGGVEDLVQFLDVSGKIDTRLVALQSIARVFEATPPACLATYGKVADRVHDFAAKFLDPDVFIPGENSAIAQQAIQALAAMGDPRLTKGLKRIEHLGRDWVAQQVLRNLQELLQRWKARSPSILQKSVVSTLSEALAEAARDG